MVTAPPGLRELRDRIDAALAATLSTHVERLGALHPDLSPLLGELQRFVLAGGKRLRPSLVVLGHRAAGGTDERAAIGPALAVELLHTAALVHDDLVDRASARRGAPTSQVVFADLHRRSAWAGDAEDFGEGAAILAGDLALVLGDRLFLEGAARPGGAHRLPAFEVYTTLREEVTAGQFLDVLAGQRRDATPALALTIAGLKSGRYSVARPLQLGAELAGDPGLAAGLYRFGVPLGQAFQLRDDVLGVFGEEQETGKSALSDLAEGKRTYLIAATAQRLVEADRRRLDSFLGDRDLDATGLEEARALVRDSGGLEATEARIDDLLDEALTVLDDLPLPAAPAGLLRQLATFLVERRA